ncbi:glycosyltransferase [Haloferax volcanii]|uniref:glycosyltransferase n=1 Tax=Haloferax volcanii TaxID=2246 RepID=UPI0009DB1709|nr:glycosyltransferase [Haloferax alexandrinus]
MSKIAVLHPNLMNKGGAESVCVNTIEALRDHEVHLFTISEINQAELDQYYNTNLTDSDFKIHKLDWSVMARGYRLIDEATAKNLHFLEHAVIDRIVSSQTEQFDMYINTNGECSIEGNSIQYIHFPKYHRDEIPGNFHTQPYTLDLFHNLCRTVSGFKKDNLGNAYPITNSMWTKNIIDEIYGVDSTVIYPPVDISQFNPEPWSSKSENFVTIGRITPDKNVLEIIKIISRVRQSGYENIGLFIIGSKTNSSYFEAVKQKAEKNSFITLFTDVNRGELADIVCSQKFGIHGKSNEHFGMAVAELVAGGAIPFVPNEGGQSNIVQNRPELQYDNIQDAVKKIIMVLEDNQKQNLLRNQLSSQRDKFSSERYKENIQSLVEKLMYR